MKTYLLLIALVVGLTLGLNQPAYAASSDFSSAIILVYHRFGEDNIPDTNVTVAQFRAQLDYLQQQHYQVWPLPKVIEYLQQGQSLPPHVVAITIDDAYRSVYTQAWPLLQRYHFPFTVFVATEPVDQHYPAMMTWDMIRDLVQHGVTIGNHSTAHEHNLSHEDAYIEKDTQIAAQRILQETGVKATLYAYPYGEYSNRTKSLAQQFGFSAALAQYSGVANSQMDFYAIPRFAINEHYGQMDRFEIILNSLPLAMQVISPADPLINTDQPKIILKLLQPNINMKQLQCFVSNQVAPATIKLNGNAIEVVVNPLPLGRSKINCTYWIAPNTWRWFGMPLMRLN